MARIDRRRFLILGAVGGAGALGLLALRFGFPWWLRPGPRRPLGDEAAALVAQCFEGLDRSAVRDCHVHVVGFGNGDTGCWVNPAMRKHRHPWQRFQYDVFTSVLDLRDPATADTEYVDRLFRLHREANPEGKLVLLAFDQHVDEDGREVPERSGFYTPNDYVLWLCRERDDALACASVHPYRHDALDRLDRAAEQGAVAVKWLPSSMGIDPASPKCDAFYRRLAGLDLPLITHGGKEYTVQADHSRGLGNPLRLRRALDAGVRVIVAHCASMGAAEDLDASAGERRERPAFDLLRRLLDETQYEGRLYADISALNQINRSGRPLREILETPRYHPRLVSGSDYPLPAIGPLFSTLKLRLEGYLTSRERRLCNEIHDANPLLFDFVVKRCLKVAREDKVYRFPPSVFETAHLFRRPALPATADEAPKKNTTAGETS